MTFKDVFGRLDAIDREAVSLLEAAGFHSDEGPGETVRPLRDPAEDIFLREFTENLLESLELLHEELTCLGSPVSREYRLELFPDGRYGFFDRDGTARRLSCGKVIEAKSLTGTAGNAGQDAGSNMTDRIIISGDIWISPLPALP